MQADKVAGHVKLGDLTRAIREIDGAAGEAFEQQAALAGPVIRGYDLIARRIVLGAPRPAAQGIFLLVRQLGPALEQADQVRDVRVAHSLAGLCWSRSLRQSAPVLA